MTKLLTILLILIGIQNVQPVQAQQKRALLIAVGNYPGNSGWKNLSSMNDVLYLRKALQVQGFKDEHIIVLSNEHATLEGIRTALKKLVEDSKTGDVVMLHFSGHGQQIFDDNGDEADGLDESIIPYDARARYDPMRYQGQQHLRDDEIGMYIDNISSAVGSLGSVMVSIDACHSGTATRSQDLAIARGEPTPFIIPGQEKVTYRPGGATTNSGEFFAPNTTGKANVIVFSASSPNQINYETQDANQQGVGSLSYALAQALLNMPADATYKDLFYSVKSTIQADIPTQIPMMEGNGLQKIFSGKYNTTNQNIYIDRWTTDSTFTLPIGTLNQIAAGATLSIIQTTSNKEVGKATIIQSTAVESIATTNAKLDHKNAYIVKIITLPAPAYQIFVEINDKANWPKATKQIIAKWLNEMPFAQVKKPANCWISFQPDSGIIILTKDGPLGYYDPSTNAALTDANKLVFTAALQSFAKSQYMRKLPDGGPLASTVTWVIKPSNETYDASKNLAFKKGETFDIELKNNGKKTIYFTLINILADNNISVLLPDETSTPQDFAIPPGETFSISGNMVDENAIIGREFLRVMVSETPFDIRPAFNANVRATRSGNPSSWELALQAIMQNDGIKKSVTRSVSANEITLLTQSFMVIK